MIGKIIRHELKDIWKHEAHDFTKWMENNLDDLSEALVDLPPIIWTS